MYRRMRARLRTGFLLIVASGGCSSVAFASCGIELTHTSVLGLQLSLAAPMEDVKSISRAALNQQRVMLMLGDSESGAAKAQALNVMHFQLDSAYDHAMILRNRLAAAYTLTHLKEAMADSRDRVRIEQSLTSVAFLAEADARQAMAEVNTISPGTPAAGIASHLEALLDSLKKIRSALALCSK